MRAVLPARWLQTLFRWRSDGTTPIRLGQRRIFILPSGAGGLFAVLLVVMLLAAINYQLSLGHALVFLLAGLGLVGMVHTFRNLHGLEISPERCPAVYAGETAHFLLRLNNHRPQARPGLIFSIGQGERRADLVAGQSQVIDLALPAEQRGWLPLPRVRLSTRYPLGLFFAWSYLQPEMRCLVYPRPLASPLPAAPAVEQSGSQPIAGGSDDFSGFRQRQPADSLRHVAWKASARDDGQRPLMVKEFSEGGGSSQMLDWYQTDPGRPYEDRLSQLCGWVLAAEQAGLHYALRLPGQSTAFGHGPGHQQRCLEMLALAKP